MVNGRLKVWRSWFWHGHCLLCRARIAAGADLCDGCHDDLPWITAACPQCATPLATTSNGIPCGDCQQKPPAFDHARAALHYSAPIDRLIQSLKYHRRLEAARTLGHLLARRLQQATPRADVIVPVPLHTSRLRQRGYNQSLELARAVSNTLNIPVVPTTAKRVRATTAQADLPLDQRARNVRNAFNVSSDVAGQHVAIVDDVMTSGHTVNALAKALRRAGAAEISVWVVARA